VKEREISKSKVVPKTNRNQDEDGDDSSHLFSFSRRKFLGGLGGAVVAASFTGFSSLTTGCNDPARGQVSSCGPIGSSSPSERAEAAFKIRKDMARLERDIPLPVHSCNGDEDLFSNKIGSYSKGLPHNDLGEVDLDAYDALINALSTGQPDDFESIPLGCPDPTLQRRLVNPQSGLAFDLEGADSHHLAIPPAPAFRSAEEAGEIAENYWMALLRDVPFTEYGSSSLAHAAAADLSNFSDFHGPKVGGIVTPDTLFRESVPSATIGPFISQFFWLPCLFGANFIEQRIVTTLPGIDYMTEDDDWLDAQRGCIPSQIDQLDPTPRYIRNGRDIGQWVHVDVLFQAYFHACLILLSIGAPFDAGNPYNSSATQDGFGTFGGPHIMTLMCEVATRALKAVWYQKWFVHRRLRPEAFAGRIHNHMVGASEYPIHSDILNSPVLDAIFNRYGTYLLPQAFPEGSPLHPAYGSGHATVAGACTTILKAWFDESYPISNPVLPTPDGLSLAPYTGSGFDRLTVGGELNKIAANVAFGRNFTGIHWRSDANESLKLGEAIAISVLRDQRATCNEKFNGFSLTKFDGTTITV
jgi:membrane-associated phospholipid phosphatase